MHVSIKPTTRDINDVYRLTRSDEASSRASLAAFIHAPSSVAQGVTYVTRPGRQTLTFKSSTYFRFNYVDLHFYTSLFTIFCIVEKVEGKLTKYN